MTIDVDRALVMIDLLDPTNKYETMLRTAAILTKLLERNNVKPIIVGGFSVEIYTNRDYATYDLDIVTSDIAIGYTIEKGVYIWKWPKITLHSTKRKYRLHKANLNYESCGHQGHITQWRPVCS